MFKKELAYLIQHKTNIIMPYFFNLFYDREVFKKYLDNFLDLNKDKLEQIKYNLKINS